MAEKNAFTAVADTQTRGVDQDSVGVVGVQIAALQSDGVTAVQATSAVVVEASWNEVDFVTLLIKRVSDGALVTSLVGPNTAGWADCPGARRVRARCIVLAGTDIPVRVNVG